MIEVLCLHDFALQRFEMARYAYELRASWGHSVLVNCRGQPSASLQMPQGRDACLWFPNDFHLYYINVTDRWRCIGPCQLHLGYKTTPSPPFFDCNPSWYTSGQTTNCAFEGPLSGGKNYDGCASQILLLHNPISNLRENSWQDITGY